MTPDFKITANNLDITTIIKTRLLSLQITDESDMSSDVLEFQLDDRGSVIEWPKHGAELRVSLGYRESGLFDMGLYVVDEVEHSGPPDTLTIRAKAANMRSSIKTKKTRSWELVEITDIVQTIASEHGLIPKVSDELGSIIIIHRDQTDESDLHFLTRLAREYDAISKPVNEHLLFVSKGKAKSVTGKQLPIIEMDRSETTSHRMNQPERNKYKSVRAFWHNPLLVKKQAVIVGNEEQTFSIRHTFATAEEAELAARAKLASLERGTGSLSLRLPGNTSLQAEGKISLKNFRSPIAGEWIVKRVEHELNSQGFTTRLDAETPLN